MKNWIKENWFKVVIGLGVLVIAGAFAYYLVVLPNQREAYKRQQDSEEKSLRENKDQAEENRLKELESSRDLCLSFADTHSSDLERLNGTKTKEGYSVPLDTREWIDRTIKAEKDECFRKYPVK